MIDLEEIKRHRALWTPDDSASLPTICEHVDALVEEVERLHLNRADIDHAYAFARNKAMLLERASVMVYLHAEAQRMYEAGQDRPAWFVLERKADEIERGEHRHKETE